MAEKRRILLVDDELSILKTVGKRLEVRGFEVLTALDGEEALAKAKAEHPEVIILDLMLPKVNGLDICAQLKKDHTSRDIPIVIMFSGRGDEQDQSQALKLGAAAYVSKIEGTPRLLEQIETFLDAENKRGQP